MSEMLVFNGAKTLFFCSLISTYFTTQKSFDQLSSLIIMATLDVLMGLLLLLPPLGEAGPLQW
jgi:hypothetical protein